MSSLFALLSIIFVALVLITLKKIDEDINNKSKFN